MGRCGRIGDSQSFAARSARQPIGLDGLLHLLGNLAVLGKMTIANEGGVAGVLRFDCIGLYEIATQTKGRVIRYFTVAMLAVHGSIIPSLLQCAHESVEVAHPLGNGIYLRPYNEHHVIREHGRRGAPSAGREGAKPKL